LANSANKIFTAITVLLTYRNMLKDTVTFNLHQTANE